MPSGAGGSPSAMISEIDIYQSAAVLTKRYGEDAALQAAQRADALLAKGDLEGQAVWLRVLAAVKDLQRRAPGEGEAVH